MKTYSVFLFDCDGTLLNSQEVNVMAFNALKNKVLGKPLTPHEAEEVFHRPSLDSMQWLGIPITDETLSFLNTTYAEAAHTVSMFDGLAQALQKLKEWGMHIGMASNRDHEECVAAMEGNDLKAYVDAFTCRTYVDFPKPRGDMLLEYLERHGIDKKDTLYIGNASTDRLAAEDAGLDYAYAMWGTTEEIPKDANCLLLHKPEELLCLARV